MTFSGVRSAAALLLPEPYLHLSAHSRVALQDVVEAMRSAFERANLKVEKDLSNAATGASAKVEAAMSSVLERLDSQIGGLMSSMQQFQDDSARSVAATKDQLDTLHTETAKAGSEAAAALQSSLSDALAKINDEIGRFQVAMQAGASAYASQAQAISSATERTRETADAFAGVATHVRTASAPLIEGGQTIASASVDLRAAVDRSTEELQRAGAASSQLPRL